MLAAQASTSTDLVDTGRTLCGCPYFASRKAVPLCQLVLLPYQVRTNTTLLNEFEQVFNFRNVLLVRYQEYTIFGLGAAA